MRVLMAGAPGSGKGTHGRRLGADLGVPHISTGELLREQVAQGSEVGRDAQVYMDRGDFVPDTVMIEMIKQRLSEPDAQNGFVLDGFPRTQVQAHELDKVLADLGQGIDAVIIIEVPIDEIVSRLNGRRSCPTCQRAYHMLYDPPRDDESCDDDGTKLEIRADDEPDTVRHRLKVYDDRTAGVIDHYDATRTVHRVNGEASVDEVSKRIEEALGLIDKGDR
jgi:adenylate kinase